MKASELVTFTVTSQQAAGLYSILAIYQPPSSQMIAASSEAYKALNQLAIIDEDKGIVSFKSDTGNVTISIERWAFEAFYEAIKQFCQGDPQGKRPKPSTTELERVLFPLAKIMKIYTRLSKELSLNNVCMDDLPDLE